MATIFPATYWSIIPEFAEESPQSPIIPTEGLAATAWDFFKYSGIINDDQSQYNLAFTDRTSLEGIVRLVQGPIRSIKDLAAAENALQALLWHDVVRVLSPTLASRVSTGSGTAAIDTYARLPLQDATGQPATLRFDPTFAGLFSKFEISEVLVCPERVTIAGQKVIQSTSPKSGLVGLEADMGAYLQKAPQSFWTATSSIPVGLGIPSYISDPRMFSNAKAGGFVHQLYEAIRVPWSLAITRQPSAGAVVEIPWLLSLVLNRAETRAKIPEAIFELWKETSKVRAELDSFNKQLQGSTKQTDVEAFCRHIEKIFGAIYPASRLTNVEKRQHRLLGVFRILQKGAEYLEAIAPGVLNPMVATLNKLFHIPFQADHPLAIIDRTSTSGTLTSLLADLETLHSLLEHFLSSQELYDLRLSIALAKNQ